MAIQFLNGVSIAPWWPRWHLGGMCLLIETDKGPVLVDTGMGMQGYEHPSRLVRFFITAFGIEMDPERAAVRQLTHFGDGPEEIKHIILTHLHFDHAGGLMDFPNAKVHLYRKEYEAMLSGRIRRWADFGYNCSVISTARPGYFTTSRTRSGMIFTPSVCCSIRRYT